MSTTDKDATIQALTFLLTRATTELTVAKEAAENYTVAIKVNEQARDSIKELLVIVDRIDGALEASVENEAELLDQLEQAGEREQGLFDLIADLEAKLSSGAELRNEGWITDSVGDDGITGNVEPEQYFVHRDDVDDLPAGVYLELDSEDDDWFRGENGDWFIGGDPSFFGGETTSEMLRYYPHYTFIEITNPEIFGSFAPEYNPERPFDVATITPEFQARLAQSLKRALQSGVFL